MKPVIVLIGLKMFRNPVTSEESDITKHQGDLKFLFQLSLAVVALQ